MELEPMAAKCAAAADTLEQRANAMPAVQTEMVDVLTLMREDYSRRVDHLHGEVDATRRAHVYELRAANRLRTKTLDAEAHAAEVTAGQLRALASMCEKGLAIAHSASFMTYVESSLHAFAGLVAEGGRIPVSADARFDGNFLADLLSRLSTLAEVSVFISFIYSLPRRLTELSCRLLFQWVSRTSLLAPTSGRMR